MINGEVVAVTERGVGAQVTQDSTAWWVQVDDASPFTPDGGTAFVNDTPRKYLSADPEKDEITFESGVTVEVDDRVEVWPRLLQVVAQVAITGQDEGTDVVPVDVPHSLRTRLPVGVRSQGERERVVLVPRGRSLVISDVLHRGPETTWGDPLGSGTDITSGGVRVRDTVMADSLSSNSDITSVGVPLVGTLAGGPVQGWLDRMSVGVVARQLFSRGVNAKPTGEEWGLAVLGATCRAGRLYKVSASVDATAGVAGGTVVARLRVSGSGPANLTSPQVASTSLGPANSGGSVLRGFAEGYIGYEEDTDVEFFTTYQGYSSATPTMGADMAITDVGPQGSYGGGEYRQIGPNDPDPTNAAKREYTSTWQATASQVYYEDGFPVPGSETSDFIEQGNDPATADGHRRSAILFDGSAVKGEVGKTIPQALTGGVVNKVEVWLTFQSWGDDMGGQAILQSGDFSALPSSWTDPGGVIGRPEFGRWKAGVGQWVMVPESWFGSGQQGVTIGGGTSVLMKHFGLAFSPHWHDANARPHLRITYVR